MRILNKYFPIRNGILYKRKLDFKSLSISGYFNDAERSEVLNCSIVKGRIPLENIIEKFANQARTLFNVMY